MTREFVKSGQSIPVTVIKVEKGRVIDIIEKDLVSIFEKNNIKKIEAKGKKFDPNIHQAMTEIDDEKSEVGSVVQEIQSGYMLGERLLRPALVGVAKKKNSKNEEKEEKKG